MPDTSLSPSVPDPLDQWAAARAYDPFDPVHIADRVERARCARLWELDYALRIESRLS